MLDISDILMITIIEREGSFNKAAPKLGTTQPALTKRMARLEDSINATIVHRSSKGVILTDFGRKIKESGKKILHLTNLLDYEMRLMSGLDTGKLRLGIGPVIEEAFLPSALSILLKEHPNLSVDIIVDNATNLLILLENGAIDIAIGAFSSVKKLKEYRVEKFLSQPIFFISRPDHPIFNMGLSDITLKDILKHPFAAPDLPLSIENWISDTLGAQSTMKSFIRSENYNLIRTIILSTDCITAAPELLFKQDIANGIIKAIQIKDQPNWTAYTVMRPETIHSPPVMKINQILKEAIIGH